MNFFKALAIIFIALFITALFVSAFPIVMLFITAGIIVAFIVFVAKGVYEVLKN